MKRLILSTIASLGLLTCNLPQVALAQPAPAVNSDAGCASGQVYGNMGGVQGCFTVVPLPGASASLGGSLLAVGCQSATVNMTGATTAMVVDATPVTYPGDGVTWRAYVSSAGVVTVKVCALVSSTPASTVYNVRVFP